MTNYIKKYNVVYREDSRINGRLIINIAFLLDILYFELFYYKSITEIIRIIFNTANTIIGLILLIGDSAQLSLPTFALNYLIINHDLLPIVFNKNSIYINTKYKNFEIVIEGKETRYNVQILYNNAYLGNIDGLATETWNPEMILFLLDDLLNNPNLSNSKLEFIKKNLKSINLQNKNNS